MSQEVVAYSNLGFIRNAIANAILFAWHFRRRKLLEEFLGAIACVGAEPALGFATFNSPFQFVRADVASPPLAGRIHWRMNAILLARRHIFCAWRGCLALNEFSQLRPLTSAGMSGVRDSTIVQLLYSRAGRRNPLCESENTECVARPAGHGNGRRHPGRFEIPR